VMYPIHPQSLWNTSSMSNWSKVMFIELLSMEKNASELSKLVSSCKTEEAALPAYPNNHNRANP
jgi:hypothetical protein